MTNHQKAEAPTTANPAPPCLTCPVGWQPGITTPASPKRERYSDMAEAINRGKV